MTVNNKSENAKITIEPLNLSTKSKKSVKKKHNRFTYYLNKDSEIVDQLLKTPEKLHEFLTSENFHYQISPIHYKTHSFLAYTTDVFSVIIKKIYEIKILFLLTKS